MKSNQARRSRQRTLPFPTSNEPLSLWSQLSNSQHEECRQVLGQLLLAVVQHERNATRDEQGLLESDQEQP